MYVTLLWTSLHNVTKYVLPPNGSNMALGDVKKRDTQSKAFGESYQRCSCRIQQRRFTVGSSVIISAN